MRETSTTHRVPTDKGAAYEGTQELCILVASPSAWAAGLRCAERKLMDGSTHELIGAPMVTNQNGYLPQDAWDLQSTNHTFTPPRQSLGQGHMPSPPKPTIAASGAASRLRTARFHRSDHEGCWQVCIKACPHDACNACSRGWRETSATTQTSAGRCEPG